MNLYSLPTDWQARTLPSLLARWPKLLALYHFGSTATGQAGPNSDADLAVLLPGQADILALWDEAQTLAGILGRSVDLIDLRAASTVMQYQIITTGQRIWALDAQAALFESFILSEKTALDTARGELLHDIQQSGRIHER